MFRWLAWRIGLVGVAALLAASSVVGQSAPSTTATISPPSESNPEPIYWRQNQFLIPYQWTSTTDPSSAAAVWLYVSKDRGVHWEKISEALPHVRAFNYHAEADGEYWFAIRTVDNHGQSWPDRPLQAELKVIVDTTIPRFGDLSGAIHGDTLEIHWQVADANLDFGSCNLEVQPDGLGQWQVVPLPKSTPTIDGISEGRASWRLPARGQTTAIRATVLDRAGNRAMFHTSVNPNSTGAIVSGGDAQQPQWPTLISGRGDGSPNASVVAPPKVEEATPPPVSLPTGVPSGWVSTSAPAGPARNEDPTADSQLWPADNASPAKSRISPGATSRIVGADVTFGKPVGPRGDSTNDVKFDQSNSINSRFVAFGGSPNSTGSPPDSTAGAHPSFKQLEPFREASSERQIPLVDGIRGPKPEAPAGTRWVNSRTFALEYEIENIGQRGISKVELWGTRDHGQTWRSYAIDADNRSPLQATVDSEGLYGFRIVVEAAGEPGGRVPRPGDRPELWVGVDLHRPLVELTAAEAGTGELAGRLVLRWHADDEHLEWRPIGLFYSSRPAGPWSTIATSLENTGEYDWQMERFVPSRIYLRVEARDLAGNVAAFQTSEPVIFDLPQPIARPGSVEPLGPTASEPEAGYR